MKDNRNIREGKSGRSVRGYGGIDGREGSGGRILIGGDFKQEQKENEERGGRKMRGSQEVKKEGNQRMRR